MTDVQALFLYRMKQARDTLADARAMLSGGLTPGSVVNRAYYAMFYAALALFLREGIESKTSKHSGVLSLFDREFVHTGKLGREYSRMFHRLFDARQEADYREFVTCSVEDAAEAVEMAERFIRGVAEVVDAD